MSNSETSESEHSDIDLNDDILVNNFANFTLRPSILNKLNTPNMTTTLSELKNLSEIIPLYNGDIKILNNFIIAVDEVLSTLNNIQLSAIQKTYLFGLIKNKLTSKAAELLSENKFTDWDELKSYLTKNFCDKSSAETILLEILQTKTKISIDKTLEIISQKFSQYKSKILLTEYSQLQKSAIIQENQKLIVSYFITLLPLAIRGSFIVKEPHTLEQCEYLLRNEFNYSHQSPMLREKQNFSFNIPPKKFPAQQFPSKPIQLDKNHSQPQMFAPRQNLKNYYETKRTFQPKPMTQQTRYTTPMSTQTIKQNYNLNESPEEDILEQIIDENIEQDNEIETDSFLELETETDEQNK